MDAQTDTAFEEPRPSAARRLAAFLRSLIPVDPAQLLFLVGTVFLLITPRLPWRMQALVPSPDRLFPEPNYDFHAVYGHVYTGNLMVLAGGLFAFYACLWPMRQALRKIVFYVIFPTLLGFSLILWKFFDVVVGEKSLLDTHSRILEILSWIRVNYWNFPTGAYFLVLSVVLIGAYCLRMAAAGGSLPIALFREEASNSGDQDTWRRLRLFIFVSVGLMTFLASVPYLLAGLIAGMPLPHVGTGFADYLFEFLVQFLNAALTLGLSLFILGSPGRSAARQSLRLPDLRAAGIGLGLPIAIYDVIPSAQYVVDRIHWAAFDFGTHYAPIFATYFDLSLLTAPWIVFLIFGAFVEEIIFRGVVLENLMQRYGLHRGIFLTGLAWAAIHFRAESYSGQSVEGVLVTLALRVIICLGMNYVFAWMFLRWKSIVPSGIAHTIWNMLVFAGVVSSSNLIMLGRYTLWFAVACVLYRYWPVSDQGKSAALPATLPEPTV